MPQRILAVDDEVDVTLIVKTALQSEGYVVETANNGPDAVALATENPPDLILLDVMMPGMTGFDVMRKLKENDKTAMIPVIMLTGVSERGKIQEALMTGSTYYIVKPFEFDDLFEKVHNALSGSNF